MAAAWLTCGLRAAAGAGYRGCSVTMAAARTVPVRPGPPARRGLLSRLLGPGTAMLVRLPAPAAGTVLPASMPLRATGTMLVRLCAFITLAGAPTVVAGRRGPVTLTARPIMLVRLRRPVARAAVLVPLP
jgi:hypothetical protein